MGAVFNEEGPEYVYCVPTFYVFYFTKLIGTRTESMWFRIFEVQLNLGSHVWSSTHANLWKRWPNVYGDPSDQLRKSRSINSVRWLERLLRLALPKMMKYVKLFIVVAAQFHLCGGFQVTGKRFISNAPSKISEANLLSHLHIVLKISTWLTIFSHFQWWWQSKCRSTCNQCNIWSTTFQHGHNLLRRDLQQRQVGISC